ncbi:MAG: hypothetical protein V4614_15115 [Pseudomonadota bacterium]
MSIAELVAPGATKTDDENILTPVKALTLPDTIAANRSAGNAVRMADTIVITSQEDFSLAAEELASIKAKWNKLEAQRTSITGPMNTALKAINALFKGPMDLLAQAETTIKRTMLTYRDEQDRIAEAARRAAQKKADEEKQAKEDEARRIETAAAQERQRLAAEETARVEKANKDREDLEAKATEAHQSGDTAAAAAIEQQIDTIVENTELQSAQTREQIEQVTQTATSAASAVKMEAAIISAPVTQVALASAKGVSKTVTWDYELTDAKQVIAHVAAHPELSNLLMLDTTKTRALVRSLGENCKIPGLRVFQKSGLSSRS